MDSAAQILRNRIVSVRRSLRCRQCAHRASASSSGRRRSNAEIAIKDAIFAPVFHSIIGPLRRRASADLVSCRLVRMPFAASKRNPGVHTVSRPYSAADSSAQLEIREADFKNHQWRHRPARFETPTMRQRYGSAHKTQQL